MKPIGRINYQSGNYKDLQNIMPGRTAEELIAQRFPNGVPANFTVTVTMYDR